MERLCIQCIHGYVKEHPTVLASIQVSGCRFHCLVGVVSHLDSPVLLGLDCPMLAHLLQQHTKPQQEGRTAEADPLLDEMILQDLKREQKKDASPHYARNWVKGHWWGGPTDPGAFFVLKEGLMYRQEPEQDYQEGLFQLLITQACRHTIMRLAHAILLAGHTEALGHVLQRFYWPGCEPKAYASVRCAKNAC